MPDSTTWLALGLAAIIGVTMYRGRTWAKRHSAGDGLDGRFTSVKVGAIAHLGVVTLELGLLNSGQVAVAYDVKMEVHSQSWVGEYQAITGEIQPGLGTSVRMRSGPLSFSVGDPLKVIVRLWTSVGLKVDERTIDIIGGTLASPPQSQQY